MTLGTLVPDSGVLRFVPPTRAAVRIEALRNRTRDKFADFQPLGPRPASAPFRFPSLRAHEASADSTALFAVGKGQPSYHFGYRDPRTVTLARRFVTTVNGLRWVLEAGEVA